MVEKSFLGNNVYTALNILNLRQTKKPKGQFNYEKSSSTSTMVLGGILEALLLQPGQ